MRRKYERIIITLIILLLIFSIIITVVLINLMKKNNNQVIVSQEDDTTTIDIYGKLENGSVSRQAYFDIQRCMKTYLDMINMKNSTYYGYDKDGNPILIVDENEIKQNIYDLLSEKYIKEKNITLGNIYSYIKTIEEQAMYVPLEAGVIQDEDITSFIIHGLIENVDYDVIDETFAILNIDLNSGKFSIEPLNGEYNSIDEIQIKSLEKVINSNNNEFVATFPSYKDIINDYINVYKRLSIGAPERMYNFLDKEYREVRFGSVDAFKEYVTANKQKIYSIRADKYQVTERDNYTQYTCIDQDGNYYIFREKAVLDYSVILDTYWVDIPEFTDRYNTAKTQEKVVLNINKFNLAINDGDYKYAYSVLADSFKEKNFPTLESFENYMKSNFFEKSKFEYASFGNEAGGTYYTYKVNITEQGGSSSKTIQKTFIMQLGDRHRFQDVI